MNACHGQLEQLTVGMYFLAGRYFENIYKISVELKVEGGF